MRAPKHSKPSMTEREHGKDEMRCSECGARLMTLKDHIQKEDCFMCAPCYHSLVYGYRTIGVEVCE
jgi:formylmethanofuran dehydrogenase subunit E